MQTYIVLAAPYYQWAASNLSKTHQDNSIDADASWMAELFTIVSERQGVAQIKSASGVRRKVPLNALVEYPI